MIRSNDVFYEQLWHFWAVFIGISSLCMTRFFSIFFQIYFFKINISLTICFLLTRRRIWICYHLNSANMVTFCIVFLLRISLFDLCYSLTRSKQLIDCFLSETDVMNKYEQSDTHSVFDSSISNAHAHARTQSLHSVLHFMQQIFYFLVRLNFKWRYENLHLNLKCHSMLWPFRKPTKKKRNLNFISSFLSLSIRMLNEKKFMKLICCNMIL